MCLVGATWQCMCEDWNTWDIFRVTLQAHVDEPLSLGLSDLSTELSRDHLSMPIESLCCIEPSTSNSSPQFVCFLPAQPLQPILNMYHLLSVVHWSDLFHEFWKSVLKTESKTNVPITFGDVVSKIWNPVFEQCCHLIDNVRTHEIKLSEVDIFFHHYQGCDAVFRHLYNLYSGLEACHGRSVQETGWINSSVHLMEQYWALCGQAEVANIILDLKESLNLTGDFEIIKHVADQVTKSMKESSLGTIDHKLIGARSFLEEISSSPWKLDCLRKFAACSSIVEWIRKETKGSINFLVIMVVPPYNSTEITFYTEGGGSDLIAKCKS